MSSGARTTFLVASACVVLLPLFSAVGNTAERLEDALSPYLRAHAPDGVDWHPWGAATIESARDRKRPVLLLMGRFGSHSQTVIERAFFEQPDWRETLQKRCFLLLVDRDERPDLDDALRLVARQGTDLRSQVLGDEPLVALLGPNMQPTLARPLTPGLATDLARVVRAMRESPGDMETRTEIVMAALEAAQRPAPARTALSGATLTRALERTVKAFHPQHGYYILSPGCPPPSALRFLLSEAERTRRTDLVQLASRALTPLARSGLRDHVGGGFFRAVANPDPSQPRFEKTLIDNALFLDVYLRLYAAKGESLPREVIRDTADWALREMRDSSGAFIHGLDAEDDLGNGRQYVWTGEQLRTLLGSNGVTALSRAYGLSAAGVLTLKATGGVPPQQQLERMREHRRKRPQPHRDERLFAGENGLMIAALARSARALDRASDLSAARGAAEAVFARLGQPDQLHRSAQGALLGGPAMLDDYAGLILGLLALDEAAPDPRWRPLATRLADEALRRFLDPTGGFFLTDDAHAPTLVRVKSADDAGRVSANALMAEALTKLDIVSGQGRYGEAARKTIDAFLGDLEGTPLRMQGLTAVASSLLAQPAAAKVARATPAATPAATRAATRAATPAATPAVTPAATPAAMPVATPAVTLAAMPDAAIDAPEPPPATDPAVAAVLAAPAALGARDARGPVTAQLVLPTDRLELRQSIDAMVYLSVTPPWDVVAPQPDLGDLNPFTVTLITASLMPGDVRLPSARTVRRSWHPRPVSVLSGTMSITLPMSTAEGSRPGEQYARVRLSYQLCDATACQPVESLTVAGTLTVVAPPGLEATPTPTPIQTPTLTPTLAPGPAFTPTPAPTPSITIMGTPTLSPTPATN